MESFIVRIYRREEMETGAETRSGTQGSAAATVGPVGTVEATATGARTAFHSHQELLSALGAPGRSARKSIRPSDVKAVRSERRAAATQPVAPAKK